MRACGPCRPCVRSKLRRCGGMLRRGEGFPGRNAMASMRIPVAVAAAALALVTMAPAPATAACFEWRRLHQRPASFPIRRSAGCRATRCGRCATRSTTRTAIASRPPGAGRSSATAAAPTTMSGGAAQQLRAREHRPHRPGRAGEGLPVAATRCSCPERLTSDNEKRRRFPAGAACSREREVRLD